MRKPLLTTCLFIFSLLGIAQQGTQPEGKTYALVVGIANYESREIPNLNFSNRDAQLFAEYLQSPAGGLVPQENIRLFIDTTATTAAVYRSLEWLKKKCLEDQEENPGIVNTVYFYFSGHGDLESQTLKQLGYLLCYNTPANNYINNAVRLEDLNYYANTLSVQLNAKVILITDACHSGKLAGSDNRGSFLVGRALSTARAKEIRIASCAPEELAQEDAAWGGGRGVFSWYLLNGMKGLADINKDHTITLAEIRSYLQSGLANDIVLKENKKIQTPVLKGNETFPLAKVNTETLTATRLMMTAKPVEISDKDHFFNLLRNRDLFEEIDFKLISGISSQEIPMRIMDLVQELSDSSIGRGMLEKLTEFSNRDDVNNYIKSLGDRGEMDQFIDSIRHRHELFRKNPVEDSIIYGCFPETIKELLNQLDIDRGVNQRRIDQYKKGVNSDKEVQQSFIEYLVEILHNSGQKIINLYLQGDVAELERRAYYNAKDMDYEVYADAYRTILKLIPADLPLARICNINLNYFSGLVARLKLIMVPAAEQPGMIERALGFQKNALALESDAAFVHNELGILYWMKQDIKLASEHFTKATELAPEWALPWANLGGLAAVTKEFEKGIASGLIADSLQANLHTNAMLQGFLFQQSGNLLLAEEYYRKAIDINPRHFFPFDGLGNVYMRMTRYALADSFFFEAELRKRGYRFNGNEYIKSWVLGPNRILLPKPCLLNGIEIKDDDVIGLFGLAMESYTNGDMEQAEVLFKKILKADPSNPLASHFLGKLYYRQQRWEPAEILFRFAIDHYLDEGSLNNYIDSVNARTKYSYHQITRDCLTGYFKHLHYDWNEDHYFLASVYERWSHFEEAETIYRELIDREPLLGGAYVKLWRQLESQGRYAEAEQIIRKYELSQPGLWPVEMNAFYRRMMERFPEDANWPYQLGLYLYEKAFRTTAQYLDTIIYFPLLNRDVFIGTEEYNSLKDDPRYRMDINGNWELTMPPRLENLSEGDYEIKIPGTGEKITMGFGPIHALRKTAIAAFEKADSLALDEFTRVDVNYKLGNLYVRSGSTKKAIPKYEKTLGVEPGHIDARMKLVEMYRLNFKNRNALAQLNYLHDSNRINFSQRLVLAEFSVHEGKFEKGKKLITEAQKIYPYPIPSSYDLLGRIGMMSNRSKDAISAYQQYLKLNPSDPTAYYNIARLYQRSGNQKLALQWLSEAISVGFNYSWVLKNDDAWSALRNTKTWNSLLGKATVKEYYSPISF